MSDELSIVNLPDPEKKTCGKCKFWFPLPRDMANLKAEQVGECRLMPPQMTAIFQQGSIGQYTAYPIIKQSFHVCSHYEVSILTTK